MKSELAVTWFMVRLSRVPGDTAPRCQCVSADLGQCLWAAPRLSLLVFLRLLEQGLQQ